MKPGMGILSIESGGSLLSFMLLCQSQANAKGLLQTENGEQARFPSCAIMSKDFVMNALILKLPKVIIAGVQFWKVEV